MADYTLKSKGPLSLREPDRKTFVKQLIGISIAAVSRDRVMDLESL
jgi:hypothetical protein